ncbi:MAG: hypothetical protein ACYCTH_13170 [Cellulomonas sp.]
MQIETVARLSGTDLAAMLSGVGICANQNPRVAGRPSRSVERLSRSGSVVGALLAHRTVDQGAMMRATSLDVSIGFEKIGARSN